MAKIQAYLDEQVAMYVLSQDNDNHDIESACLHEVLLFCMDHGATLSAVPHLDGDRDHDRRSPYHLAVRMPNGHTIADGCTIGAVADALVLGGSLDVE